MITSDYIDYYQKEMGVNLKRQFVSFQRLAKPEWLIKVKRFANRLEKKLSVGPTKSNRRINIDSGYISAGKLVLATNKNHQRRSNFVFYKRTSKTLPMDLSGLPD